MLNFVDLARPRGPVRDVIVLRKLLVVDALVVLGLLFNQRVVTHGDIAVWELTAVCLVFGVLLDNLPGLHQVT